MIGQWSNWKPFPDASLGGHLEAPIGPGVYEVCLAETREQVAFGYAKNLAGALSKIAPSDAGRTWRFFRKPRYSSSEIEYRTCPAGSVANAKVSAGQLISQRQAVLRRFSAVAR